MIILQTVLEEVRHRSSPIYKRLRDLAMDPKRHFYVFINEHHKDTFIERNPGESVNDRNDRAIRVASKWYHDHLGVISHKKSLITIFGHIHKIKNFNIPWVPNKRGVPNKRVGTK